MMRIRKHTKFYWPAEWETHQATWLAWPFDEHLWKQDTWAAQKEFIALCQAILEDEPLELLVPDFEVQTHVQKILGQKVKIHIFSYADSWLRDTGPIFLKDPETQLLHAACFKNNGWGGKYFYPNDLGLAQRIAQQAQVRLEQYDWVLEGGSLEVDGQGLLLTTEAVSYTHLTLPTKRIV